MSQLGNERMHTGRDWTYPIAPALILGEVALPVTVGMPSCETVAFDEISTFDVTQVLSVLFLM